MSSSESETKQKIKLLKKIVLEDQMGFLCEELGDPGRYFPYLRSKRMLDSMDCQSIRSQVTFKEQVQQLIGVLKGRQSSKGEHAFDVLVEALKKQRVQAHIARTLQKALAKAEEENVVPDGVETRTDDLPEEEVADQSSLPYSTLTSNDVNGSEPYEIHPLHGALPPCPTDAIADSPILDMQHSIVHPQHGLLPSKSDDNIFVQQEPKAEGSAYDSSLNDSESELGGQSQPGSMLTASSYADSSMYTSQSFSHGTASTFTRSGQNDSVDILKLEAQIKDLNARLEEALAENKMKEVQIMTLHQQLEKSGISEQGKGISSFHSYGSKLMHSHKLKMNGSDSQMHTSVASSGTYFHGGTYHSAGSISPKSLYKDVREQPQRLSERPSNSLSTNFIDRSKSSSPSASVSFV